MTRSPLDDPLDEELRPIPVAQARLLRDAVLRRGLPPGGSVYPGDDAPDTLHLGAFAGGRLVGVATLCEEPPPGDDSPGAWRLRGMAIVPDCRGRGVGTRLAGACLAYAHGQGGTVVWCSARQEGASFYARLGFAVVGEPFRLPQFGDRTYIRMQRKV